MTRVVGLDLSLTSPGVALMDGHAETWKPRSTGVERLAAFREWVIDEIVNKTDAQLVVIEGYSFGSRNGGERIGEAGGVVRLALRDMRVPFVEVAPASLKRYATGKGNASKDEVLIAAVKRSDIAFTDNNQADAFWLRQMGLAHYEPSAAVSMPKAHLSALEAVSWPSLHEAVA